MTNRKNIIKKIYAILLIIITLFTTIFTPLTAFASTERSSHVDITKSSVRDDLASMGEDKLTYLSDSKNIFIAMSQYYDTENKLRTYVYFNYVGSTEEKLKISLSVAVSDSNNNITDVYKDYELSFINSEKTWVKYEILGLPNAEHVTRRYNVKSISSSNVILEINETYIFHGITNETIEVFKQEVETITITEKDVRFFCYGEESQWYDFFGVDGLLGHNKKYTDAWYIFFNTDKPMDDLLEIEITYMPYDYHIQFMGGCKMSTAITDEVLQERLDAEAELDEETTRTYGEQTVVTITPGKTKVSSTKNWWGGLRNGI